MVEHEPQNVGEGVAAIAAKTVFDLYVQQLAGDTESLIDALVVRLRWFAEDVTQATKRLTEDPRGSYEIISALSTVMQDIDARAGASEASQQNLSAARRWALLIPETDVHS